MNDPIPIGREPENVTHEQAMAWEKQKQQHRLQIGFFTVLGIGVLCFLVPLGVFLTRLALG